MVRRGRPKRKLSENTKVIVPISDKASSSKESTSHEAVPALKNASHAPTEVNKSGSDLQEASKKVWKDFREKRSSLAGEKLSLFRRLLRKESRSISCHPGS